MELRIKGNDLIFRCDAPLKNIIQKPIFYKYYGATHLINEFIDIYCSCKAA